MHPLEEHLSFQLLLLIEEIRSGAKPVFQDLGITYGNFMTLLLIREHPGVTQAGLSDLNFKDRNVMGRIIDKLETKGYVLRRRDKTDRRAYTLYLTTQGEELVTDYREMAHQSEQDLLSRLSQEEMHQFFQLLAKLRNKGD